MLSWLSAVLLTPPLCTLLLYIFSALSQSLELFGRVPTHSCIQTHTYVQTDIRLMIYIRIETKDDDERTKDILNKKKQIIYRIVL